MKIKNLKTGQKVLMKLMGFPEEIEIESHIVGVEKDRLRIMFPEKHSSKMYYFREGQEVELSIYFASKVIIMASLVINTPYEEAFTLELNDEFIVIQRRQYVRADIPLDISLYQDGRLCLSTKTLNISGGGFKMVSDGTISPERVYGFSFKIPNTDFEITGNGVVLQTVEDNGSFVSMFKIKNIKEDDRNKIIKLCLEHEMKVHQAMKEAESLR